MENVNMLSLVIATLLPMITGMIFYHKAIFGKPWMRTIGLTEEKQKSANTPVMMIGSLVAAALIAFFMLTFCNGAGQEGEFDTFKHGAAHGVVISLFFVIPIFISKGLFEMRPVMNMVYNGLYWLITLALMGGILDAMNHFPN